jgi:hypothetical protein
MKASKSTRRNAKTSAVTEAAQVPRSLDIAAASRAAREAVGPLGGIELRLCTQAAAMRCIISRLEIAQQHDEDARTHILVAEDALYSACDNIESLADEMEAALSSLLVTLSGGAA